MVTRPALVIRYQKVPGARYYAWPVYYDTQEDRLCYEAEGSYLIQIGREDEGCVFFSDYDDGDEQLAQMIADRIGVER